MMRRGYQMLRYLTVSNYKSIGDAVELSMVATRERRHGDRLARVGRSRVLPVAALYGANAAGKSTLVDALAALQRLVTEGRSKGEPLPVVPHRLTGRQQPTTMGVEIVVPASVGGTGAARDWVFYYEVTADRREVHQESLARLRSADEEVLFERVGTEVTFYGELADDETAQAAARLLIGNQTVLGLLGSVEGGPATVVAVRSWFSDCLRVIYPGADYVFLPERLAVDEVFADAMNRGLSTADTGISRIDFEDVPASRFLSQEQVAESLERLTAEGGRLVLAEPSGDRAVLSLRDDGELRFQRMVAVHDGAPGADSGPTEGFSLPLNEESDGTARFMNLLPILFQLDEERSRSVFVVDELENSMHPLLTQELIRTFLDGLGPDGRRQLIFTTHELQLMRAPLLRRDEIWLVDKKRNETGLTRLSDFSGEGVRADADLLGIYTSGRLGGVPRI